MPSKDDETEQEASQNSMWEEMREDALLGHTKQTEDIPPTEEGQGES